MLDHAREAIDMARGRHREALESHGRPGLAMTRLLEIISEAAARRETCNSGADKRRQFRVDWTRLRLAPH